MSNFSLSLRQSADRYPERMAVIDGPATLTYGTLDARVDALASSLISFGIGGASTVAVISQNCLEIFELYFAVMRVGAVFFPLNYRLSHDEIAYQIDRARVDALFVGADEIELAQRAAAAAAAPPRLLPLGSFPGPTKWPSYEDLLKRRGRVADASRALDDVQRIMFTSGTTAHPKAVMTTHGQVWFGALARATEFQFNERDVTLVNGPLYHAGALDHFATTHIMVGGCVVVTRTFDPGDALALLERHAVTSTWMSPTMVRMVSEIPGWDRVELPVLRVLLVGGENMPEHLVQRLREAWPGTELFDCYGLTESSFATHINVSRTPGKGGSVGRATIGTQVRVVSGSGAALAAGEPGEIQISGPCVFPGYLDDAQATEKAFATGWLRTGDIGYLDDGGYLFLVDRLKDMIRSGGENIACPEIERIVYEVPGVLEVAVVGAPDERWGEVPVAFVVADPTIGVSADAVLAHARACLGRIKVPTAVYFVDLLPRTPSGKLMKRVLRDAVTAGGAPVFTDDPERQGDDDRA